MASRYWADAPIEDIAAEIEGKFDSYHMWGKTTGYFGRIKTCYDRYYGFDQAGTVNLEKSEDGKTTRINAGHYKSLIKRLHILVMQNKLTYQPRALNSDTQAQITSDLGKGLLEYYSEEKHMHSVLSQSVELALIALEAWIFAPWDKRAGAEVAGDVSTGEVVKNGDQRFHVLSAFDVARSTTLKESPYKIVRMQESKWNLAAQYPEFESDIISGSVSKTTDAYYFDPTINQEGFEDDDAVYVFYLFHEKNDAMPDGRLTRICEGNVLSDENLEYREIPCYQVKADTILQTTLCDSPSVDLLSLQEAINLLISGMLTNNLNNCVQNVYSRDPNIVVRPLSPQQNLIIAAEPPVGINFTNSSPESYKLTDILVSWQQLISGVNSTARGQPEASLKSGNSLALMLAQAIQYVSELQKNYAEAAGNIGTAVIHNIQDFAKAEMVAYIAGNSRKYHAKRFMAEDLKGIDRIVCDLGNPITQSVSGRYELIQQFMQFGMVKDPKMIATFLRTGELDSVTENPYSDSILIREENESLRRGEVPPVVKTDMHPEHIMEHRQIFSDLDARRDPRILNAVFQHIQEHLAQNQRMSVEEIDLMAILGMQPLPSTQQPPPGAMPEPGAAGTEVQGQSVPNVPPGTPPSVAANYDQAMQGIPNSESQMPVSNDMM